MAYFKDYSIILAKKNIKEKSSIIYILSKNFGIKKLLAEGINRPESKLLSVVQPGAIGKIFWIEEEKYSKLISFLHYKIPYKVYKLYPYSFLWALRTLIIFNFFEVSNKFWQILWNLDKFIFKFKNHFSLWFMIKILEELGIKPNIETCSNCNLSLRKNIYRYKSSLFCENCKKIGYEKIDYKDYLEIKKFFNEKITYLKNKKTFNIIKTILKEHLKEI